MGHINDLYLKTCTEAQKLHLHLTFKQCAGMKLLQKISKCLFYFFSKKEECILMFCTINQAETSWELLSPVHNSFTEKLSNRTQTCTGFVDLTRALVFQGIFLRSFTAFLFRFLLKKFSSFPLFFSSRYFSANCSFFWSAEEM